MIRSRRRPKMASQVREDHPRHSQMEDVVDSAEAIPDDPAEEHDRESLWNIDGDPESADDAEEEIFPSPTSCVMHLNS